MIFFSMFMNKLGYKRFTTHSLNVKKKIPLSQTGKMCTILIGSQLGVRKEREFEENEKESLVFKVLSETFSETYNKS